MKTSTIKRAMLWAINILGLILFGCLAVFAPALLFSFWPGEKAPGFGQAFVIVLLLPYLKAAAIAVAVIGLVDIFALNSARIRKVAFPKALTVLLFAGLAAGCVTILSIAFLYLSAA
jgi:hypothetical protein